MSQIPFKGKHRSDLFMEPEEYKSLIEAAGEDEEAKRLLTAMCPGGLRTIEVTWLRVKSLDTSKGGLWVKTAKRKDGWVRFIGLDDAVMEILSKATDGRASNAPLFLCRGRPVEKRQIRYLFHKYKERAEIRNTLGPHSLRHLTGIMLSESGYSPQEIANYLGHSNLAQVLVYSSLRSERNKEMGRSLWGRLKAPVTNGGK